jgi:nitroimidazol reductase NimA-like FMN-containing flavoprotein (pyridoxamine 5'-phosphate oxidase superfamily)
MISPVEPRRDGAGPPGCPLNDTDRQFLSDNTRVYLIVGEADDRPMGYPMTGRWESDALEFSTYRKSAKVRHIERDPRVCCLVTSRDRTVDGRVLVVWGWARVGAAGQERWRAALQAPDGGPRSIDVPETVRQKVASRLETSKRVIVRVEVETAMFAVSRA